MASMIKPGEDMSSMADKLRVYDLGKKNVSAIVSAREVESEDDDYPIESVRVLESLRLRFPGLAHDDVEAIYACTPMQEAILVSRARGATDYLIKATFALQSLNGAPIDVQRLEAAWARIVQQSAILRTTFVPSPAGENLFFQVVLKTVPTAISHTTSESADTFIDTNLGWAADYLAPHRLVLCHTPSGEEYLRIEMHHSVTDAHACYRIFHELMRFYDDSNARLHGPQFRDLVQYLQGFSEEHRLDYWQAFLENAQPSVFPQLRIGDSASTTARGERQVQVDREKILALTTADRENRVGLSVFFHVVWAILLRAYLGRDDVLFGYVSSGRRNVPISNTAEGLGPYICMMIARARMDDGSLSWTDLARQLRDNISRSGSHEHCSLASIQRRMQSNGGLFNTLVDVQRLSKLARTSSKMYMDLVHVHTVAEYDLVLKVEETSDDLVAKINYKASLLDLSDVENIAACFSSIVDQLLEDPCRRITSLKLFTDVHRKLVQGWTTDSIPVYRTSTNDMIQAEADRRPTADAVCSYDLTLTYGRLCELSNGLASKLVSTGAGPGSLIPLCMDRSPWAIVAMLGIMRTGSAFVPIDPSTPPLRVREILKQTSAILVVVSPSTRPVFQSMSCDLKAIHVVDEELLISAKTGQSPRVAMASWDDAAYVLFTSGSTGTPKGVVVTHASLCSAMNAFGPAMGIDSTTRSFQFAAYTFDAVIAETLAVLVRGGVICIPSEEDRLNDIPRAINELQVNWAMLTPTVVRLLDPSAIPTLQCLVLIGEAVDQHCVDRWRTRVRLFNGYGPTETCVVCVVHDWSNDIKANHTAIGYPAGCRCWVVDPTSHNHLSPLGAVGELLIEGPNVASGYFRDSNLTARSFIREPEWKPLFRKPTDGANDGHIRYYRTGDLVRQMSNGQLQFVGRVDGQKKVNGQRLEVAEIEHHLVHQSSVVHALVDVPKAGRLQGRLIAVLALRENTGVPTTTGGLEITLNEMTMSILPTLRDALHLVLPGYMVPTTWIPVHKMPVLASGKLDRRDVQRWIAANGDSILAALSELQAFDMNGGTHLEEIPEVDSETRMIMHQIRGIWSSILDTPSQEIGMQRHFAAMGGDSIAAMRVVSQARVQGWHVTVRDILRYSTISALAPHVRRLEPIVEQKQTSPVGSRFSLLPDKAIVESTLQDKGVHWSLDDIEDVYPCSPTQEGMIVSQLRTPERNLYNFKATWKVTTTSGESIVDIERLEAACVAVIQRHQILRTVFFEVDDADHQFVQVVMKHATTVGVPIVRSSSLTHRQATSVLDTNLFPYEWCLSETDQGVYCTLTMNHCLLDGSCLPILAQDIALAYDSTRSRPLAPLYSSFIAYLRSRPADAAYDFWKARLMDTSPCHFPRLAPVVDESESTSKLANIPIPDGQAGKLRGFCRERGFTLAGVMNTVWAIVLQAYLGHDDASNVCFGYMASGRDAPVPGADELAGPLLSMLVQSVDLEPTRTGTEILSSVKEDMMAGLEHQHCSWARIYNSLEFPGNALFNTLVNVQRTEQLRHSPSNEPLIRMNLEDYSGSAEFDVVLDVVDSREGITARLLYWTSCISDLHAQNVASTVAKTLQCILEAPSQPICELDLVADDHHRQLRVWNPSQPHTVNSCLHHLFEEQAGCQPEAPAVCTTGSEGNWTYAELNDMASQLATYLVDLGVVSDMAVPFCFDKSPWTVVVVLATLKAGGACVALDPSFPMQRLEEMIGLTAAKVIICEEIHAERFSHIRNLTIVSFRPSLLDSLPPARAVPDGLVTPRNAAWINFTSGSTGVPKGGILEHRSICSAVWHHRQVDPVGKQTRSLQFSSYTFDASFAEMFLTLCSGGCLCVPTEDERMNHLAATIRGLQVNWMYLTPTVVGLLDPKEVPGLRTICLGGEPVLDGLVCEWLHHVRLIATYGPSECSIAISRSQVCGPGNGQLGPASGALLWIVNPTNPDRLVPVGAPGELLIEGPLVGRGYLEQAQTDRAYIVDPGWTRTFPVPCVPATGRRMFRTGDIVRFEPDGSMVMLGRRDTQVKIHGQRVDLGEIEHHILASDQTIRQAACLVVKKGPFAGQLTAVLSAMKPEDMASSASPTINIIHDAKTSARLRDARSKLEECVPAYMIPREWIMLAALPLSLSGKLNRRALLHWLETVDGETYDALTESDRDSMHEEMSPMEELLRRSWSSVLRIPQRRIDRNCSFYSVGGDSLSAIRVSSVLSKEGVQVSMGDIMRLKTIGEIAMHINVAGPLFSASSETAGQGIIQQQLDAAPRLSQYRLLPSSFSDNNLDAVFHKLGYDANPANVEDIYPCSPMQEGILLSQVKQSGLYDTSISWRAIPRQSDVVDARKLQSAIAQVVARHQILRTRFIPCKGALPYVQVVLRDVAPPIVCLSCEHGQDQLRASLPGESAADPCGLGYRFVISTAATGDLICKLDINHALIDGQSVQVLLRDILLAYDGVLPETSPPPRYGDFMAYLGTCSRQEELAYWTNVLSGISPCILRALTRSTPDARPVRFNTTYRRLDKTLARRLHATCAETGTTVSGIMSIVWAIILRAYTGADSVCFGHISSGRGIPVPQVESILGPLITMMVTRVDLDDQMSVQQLIRQIGDSFLDSIPYQHCPLSEIQHAIGHGGHQGRLFNTAVNVKTTVASTADAPTTMDFEIFDVYDPTEFDVTFNVDYDDSNVALSLHYWSSFIDNEEAQLMKDTAVQTLITLLDNLSDTVAGLELLNPAHRSRLLAGLQTIPEVKPTTVHELVELVAHTYPSNPAICTSTLTLTYGRLDALSSQLAQHLAFLGATPGTPVAFCLDRSPLAVVTIYAILKAGGACLPLSPDDSLSQHRTILGWTRAMILVTDKKYASQFEELEGIVVLTDCDDINASGMHSQIEHLRGTVPTRANPGSAAFMSFQSEPQSPSSGVVFDHASISTSIEYAKVAGVLDGCDRSLHLFPYTSIVSIAEVFTALAMAATVCIPSDDEKAQHLSSFVKRQNVKFAHLTPMLACQLDPSDTALCTVAFGGERIPHGLLRAWTNCTNVLEYHEYMCPTTYSRLQDGTIGKPIGTLTWVADCKDPNKLAPVGCPGELLIESPIMPRSYLDQGQAGKSFLVDPAWTTSMPVSGVTGSRILLRTGQLARQNPDGTLVALGRHDSRVQIQGNNINMDEINAKLSDQLDSSVATLVPTQGHWCEKLVVVFSPARQPAPMGKELEIWVTDDSATKIEEMSRALQDQDHFHTLPLVWIPVVGLPITPYGKLDREKVKCWVHELDEESCERIGSIGQAQIQEVVRSEVERELVSVWSEVLGIPEAMVATDQSFFRLGGDSMAAMHAAREMQSRGLPIAVHDILRLRTITALAELVKVAGHNMRAPEVALNRVPDSIDTPFPLTPIQVMHFQAYSDGLNHFNQSCFLRCRRWLTKDELYDVLLQLVEYHSMLNARFSTDRDGTWTQRIIQNSSKSFKLLNPTFSSVEEAQSSFRSVQESLDIRDGPLLAASLMDVNEEQFLFVAVHHLVVDMVSWGILLDDLEALLIDKPLGPKPMSFQSWATAQNEYARRELTPTKVLASAVAITDSLSNYWGTRSQLNTYNTAERSQITLDAGTTALILGGANDALGTEPFEILLALILCSFGNVFTDRGLPVVFSEGHGRETWIDKADISRTVGWFTTMFPISISKPGHSSDLSLRVVQTLRLVKDYRRTLPGSGWPYFASRYLNEQGSASFAGHENMEILFNHLGSAGNRPRKRLLEAIAIGDASDVSPSATMAALFEITSVVQNGHLCIRFLWSPNVRHQSKIKLWTSEFENLASFAATMLAETPPMFTRADFPLLNLETNAAVDSIVHHCLTQLQMSDIAQIESIHPCSPMQEGILLSRSRTQGVYDVRGIWKVTTSMPQASVDLEKLRKACEQVVVLHDILRTYFAQGLGGDSAFLQIVMKEVSPPVQIVQLRSLDELQQLTPCHKSGLPYTFTICRITNGDVFFRLDINHALIDGTSTRLLLNDLSRAYAGRLPSTGATYRDFIAHLHSIPREEGLTFWTEMLKDTRPCHFPLLNEWAAGGPPTFRTVEIELTIGQSKQLNDFCKRHDTTLANFMSAIWALVLSCYVATDEERVTFGYLASGRDLPVAGAQSIMGPMITMIARQADIDPETTVLQLMQKMQQDFASSFPHQHVSLAEIHRALSLQSTPLFNTIVNMQRARVSVPNSDTELVWQAETGHDPSEYDITFNIIDGDDVWLHLGYWDRCLSETQARSLSQTIHTAISSVLDNPHKSVVQISMVSSEGLQQYHVWNKDIPERRRECIHHRIEDQVRDHPEAPAVCSTTGVSLSYREFNAMADALANTLCQLGVGPESLVPFCMDKSPWTSIVMVAILKAGGACVALDPSHPIQRLEGIIRESEATVILAAPAYASRLTGLVPHILCVTEDIFLPGTPCRNPLLRPCEHTNPAFVIFTSGSTGKPKGIVVEHGAFCSSAHSHAPALRMHRQSRVLQFASYTYDLSIAETFTTLMVGGCICVPSELDRLNRLAEAIREMQVTWMFLTPTVAALLRPEQVPTVQTIVLGGEHATENNLSTWGGRDDVCLINSYGPAECSIWTNASIGVSADGDTSNIGRRFGCSLWVVDRRNHHRLLPMGARGELVIGGPTLARGYLQDAAKTTAAFIRSPEWTHGSVHSGQRFYKSGDLARYNADGSLSIQGRKDMQVKVHGHRIELGDIELNLARIASVEHAVVQLPRSSKYLQGRLVAVLTLADTGISNEGSSLRVITEDNHRNIAIERLADIRTTLEDQLPKHMLPTVWVPVERMPLLASGKLDKRTVKSWLESIDNDTYRRIMSLSTAKNESATVAENAAEVSLQQIWATVLKYEPDDIGMTQSFLALGGDSISATQVVSRARAAGLNIYVQDILRLRTIRKLAQQAAAAGPIGKPSPMSASPTRFAQISFLGSNLDAFVDECVSNLGLTSADDIEDIFPCSPMQEGILISQAQTDSNYRVRALFQVVQQSSESIDVNRLARSLSDVACRHQALRTVFTNSPAGADGLVQVVLKNISVPAYVLDDCQTLAEFQARDQVRPYSEGGLPYRFSVCQVASGEVYCQLAINHALEDGSSMHILLRDLCLSYDGILSIVPRPLYSSFISYIRKQPHDEGVSFWTEYLAGAVPTLFPVLTTTSPTGNQAERADRFIDGPRAAAFRQLCETHEITVADAFKAVWAVVLATMLGTDSVCFGYLASGRDAPVENVHEIVGPLINMLIFRAHIKGSATLIDIMQEARNHHTRSLSHQHCSLKEILHHVNQGHTPLFNTLVNVQRATNAFFVDERDSTADRSLTLRNITLDDPTEYDMSLDVMESKTKVHVMLHFSPSAIDSELAEGLADIIVSLIDQAVDQPSQPISQLRLSTSRHQQQVFRWNPEIPDYPGRCLHEAIEEQVARSPTALAVVSDEGSFTYRQLDEMANRLAHHLMDMDIHPEAIVPCCFEKSPWAVVAMLAVLKAGATCLALDAALPLQRLSMMIGETKASIMLVSAKHANRLASTGDKVIAVSQESLEDFPQAPRAPKTTVTPANAAFLVYTSGSTGTPKGAVLEHRNLYATARGYDALHLTNDSRVAHFSSYAYDVSIEETILTLARGACICIISEDDRLGNLTGALNRLEVTWADLTPTVLRMLEPDDLPSLKTVILGGELLTDDIIQKWHDRVQLFNSYGPCECAIFCCLSEQLRLGDRGAVIGKPYQSNLWIVHPDNHEQMLPVGAIGELCLQGPLVGRGYLNDTTRTKAAFVDAPAWARTAESSQNRFYKTGDLARWNPDGTLTYIGRKDNQIKIHGQRIELGEIEHQVSSVAGGCARAVVAAVPQGGRLKQRLVVLLAIGEASGQRMLDIQRMTDSVQLSAAQKQIADIRARVMGRLPRHMVPTLWIPVDDIPTLPSGKTNRRLINQWLVAVDQETHADIVACSLEPTAFVMPSSPMEERLQAIWADVLDLPLSKVSMSQSFFALGGDSVLAIKLLARCKEYGIVTRLQDIFRQASIPELAVCCTTASESLTNSATELARPILEVDAPGAEDVYLSTPMQQSIIAAQKQVKNSWYASWVVEVAPASPGSPPVRLADIAKSWQQVVDAHPILRTYFQVGRNSGKLYQVVLKHFTAPVSYLSMSSTDAASMFNPPPDMPPQDVPPHRMVLAEAESGSVMLQLQISHALYDAVSLSILWHDLQFAYTQRSLKQHTTPYRSFISHLSRLDSGAALNFWMRYLSNAQPCCFPHLNREIDLQSANQHPSGSFVSAEVPFAGTRRVREVCKKYAVTTANLFQAIWALVLNRYTCTNDVCFGFMLSGRDTPLPSVETIMGPLINLLPCRVTFTDEMSLGSVLRNVQSDLADILTNQHCSSEEIHCALGMGTEKRLFNTFLNMQRVSAQAPYTQSSIRLREVNGYMIDEYAISVYVVDSDDEISISFSYWTSVLSPEQVHDLSRAIVDTLELF